MMHAIITHKGMPSSSHHRAIMMEWILAEDSFSGRTTIIDVIKDFFPNIKELLPYSLLAID